MKPQIALLICALFVFWSIISEKKRNLISSVALWVPTIWFLICSSRPVGRWFGVSSTSIASSDLEGSLYDRSVLTILTVIAIIIIIKRRVSVSELMRRNVILIVAYIYLGVSVLWGDYSYVLFKRWIRSSIVILMSMVVLSEDEPLKALEVILRRCAYVVIPFSVVCIKYYPYIGREYSRWEGAEMWIGVGMQKNGLGIVCAFSVFFLLWSLSQKWEKGKGPAGFDRYLSADILVVILGMYILRGPGGSSYSATAMIALASGTCLMIVLFKFKSVANVVFANARVSLITAVVLYLLFSQAFLPSVTAIVGRSESLTGRTEIWREVRDIAARNPIIGVGYGGFWGIKSADVDRFQIKQSHNGYLDVYLELGMVGMVLLFLVFMESAQVVSDGYFVSRDWSVYGLCLLIVVLLFNTSESGFFVPSYLWIVLVFFILAYSKVIVDYMGRYERT